MSDATEEELETAVILFAHYLEVDVEKESCLIPVVRDAMMDLPKGWEIGIGEGEHKGIPFFFNEATGESEWKHPRELECRKTIEEQRIRKMGKPSCFIAEQKFRTFIFKSSL